MNAPRLTVSDRSAPLGLKRVGSARQPRDSPSGAPSSTRRGRRLVDWTPYGLNAPAILIILLVMAYPIGDAFWTSLHRYNLKRPNLFAFIGIDNYLEILASPAFWQAIGTTLLFTTLSVVLAISLGLALALVLNEPFHGRAVLRSLVLIPWAIPPVAGGLMWRWILNGNVGALNGLLYSLGLSSSYYGWLSDPQTALFAVVAAHVWNTMPIATLVLLAALQVVPAEIYDAAKVDGANATARFRSVTFPWLIQPMVMVLILETMLAFRVFDLVYVLTSGGPGDATTVISWLTYHTSFTSLDLGRGNAYAFLMALIVGAMTLAYIRLLYRRGEV